MFDAAMPALSDSTRDDCWKSHDFIRWGKTPLGAPTLHFRPTGYRPTQIRLRDRSAGKNQLPAHPGLYHFDVSDSNGIKLQDIVTQQDHVRQLAGCNQTFLM